MSWGLADPVSPRLSAEDGRLLGPFLTASINGRTEVRKPTVNNFKQVRQMLVPYFGERNTLKSITAADGERWRRWMLARVVKPATPITPAKPMAEVTVSKHCKRAKQMMAEAVADRLPTVNAFGGLRGGDESKKARELQAFDALSYLQHLESMPH